MGGPNSGKRDFYAALDMSGPDTSSIGIDFKLIEMNNQKFQIWDMAGQERFRLITNANLRSAKFILIFGSDFEEVQGFISTITQEDPGFVFSGITYNMNNNVPGLQDFSEDLLAVQLHQDEVQEGATKAEVNRIVGQLLPQVVAVARANPVVPPVVKPPEKKKSCVIM